MKYLRRYYIAGLTLIIIGCTQSPKQESQEALEEVNESVEEDSSISWLPALTLEAFEEDSLLAEEGITLLEFENKESLLLNVSLHKGNEIIFSSKTKFLEVFDSIVDKYDFNVVYNSSESEYKVNLTKEEKKKLFGKNVDYRIYFIYDVVTKHHKFYSYYSKDVKNGNFSVLEGYKGEGEKDNIYSKIRALSK